MESKERILVYNELVPLKTLKQGMHPSATKTHYFALDVSPLGSIKNEKQFIICTVNDLTNFQIIEREKAFSKISTAFSAYWSGADGSVMKQSIDNFIEHLKPQLSTKIDSLSSKKSAKILVPRSSGTQIYEAPLYTDYEVREILWWIDQRSHSDEEYYSYKPFPG